MRLTIGRLNLSSSSRNQKKKYISSKKGAFFGFYLYLCPVV